MIVAVLLLVFASMAALVLAFGALRASREYDRKAQELYEQMNKAITELRLNAEPLDADEIAAAIRDEIAKSNARKSEQRRGPYA